MDEVRTYLDGMDTATLTKLQTLMYVGRENWKGDFGDLQRELMAATQGGDEDLIGTIASKAEAYEYLENGLRIAKERGIDLEADFG